MAERPLLVVRVNFNDPAREKEYNEWYNNVHVPDLLKVPGIISATRYEIIRGRRHNTQYLTLYEIESEEMLDAALSGPEAVAAREDADKTWGDADSELFIGVYRPIKTWKASEVR